MKMKFKTCFILLVALVAILFAGLYWNYSWHEHCATEEGHRLVKQIEEYRAREGKYPNHINVNQHWIYTSYDDDSFNLRCYFWASRDSLYYSSGDKTWRLDKDD